LTNDPLTTVKTDKTRGNKTRGRQMERYTNIRQIGEQGKPNIQSERFIGDIQRKQIINGQTQQTDKHTNR